MQVLHSSAQITVVGSTEGVFDVSDLGGARYAIPIKVPEGVGGLQPEISLTYNSQGGNGPLGMGWSIGGLSAITRSGNTIYNDKVVTGVALTTADKFVLDGNRLLVTSGAYGAAGSQYRTEIETFRSVVANGTLGNGPASFTITDQEGRIYEYGATANAQAVVPGRTEPYMWMLSKVTDLKGNYITYEYVNNNGEVVPSTIKYNCNQITGTTFQTYVSFSYTTNADPNFNYLAAGKIASTKKINKISVIQKEGTLWHYYRSYLPEYSDDFYTHLVRVKEQGVDQAEALPATELSYGPVTPTALAAHSELQSGANSSFAVGDYNGDGKTDLLRFSTANNDNSFTLFINQGEPNAYVPVQSGTLNYDPAFNNLKNTIKTRDQAKSIAFDYNGDGKDDFVYIQSQAYSPCNCQSLKQRFYIYLSSGNSITPLDRPIVPTANPGTSDNFGNLWPLIGDFDGDGKSELFAVSTNSNSSYNISYMMGERYNTATTTTGPFNAPTPYPVYVAKSFYGLPFTGANGAKLFVVDYNGDGKSDIMQISGGTAYIYEMNVTYDANNLPVVGSPAFRLVGSSGYPSQWHNVYTGDFNGDAITDVLTYYDGVGWEVGYGNGAGQINLTAGAGLSMAQPYSNMDPDVMRPILISDFNGDGKDDIYDYTGSVMEFGQLYDPTIRYSKGNNTFVSEVPGLDLAKVGYESIDYFLGDFNGDGAIDFTTRFISDRLPYVVSFHPNESRHLLTQVKSGLGATTKVTYQPLTNASVYSPGTNLYLYPFVKRTLPIKVVAVVNNDNGTGTAGNDVNYSYKSLKLNAHGKGLLGFDQISAYNVTKDMLEGKNFGLNGTYAYPYLQSKWAQQAGVTMNSSYSTYAFYDYGNKRILPYVSESGTSDYITGATVKTNNNYTFPPQLIPFGVTYSINIGKPSSTTITKGSGLETVTQTFTYPNYADVMGGNPVPVYVYSKPSSVTTTATRQGQPSYTRKETFSYNNTFGWLIQSVKDPGTANALTSSYWYDEYGNLVRKQESAAGLTNRIQRWTYEGSKRYVTESYNEAYPNVKKTTTYNAISGLKLTETDPDGYTTTYTYDAFGREKTITDNNGKSTTLNYIQAAGNPYATSFSQYAVQKLSNTAGPSYTFYDRLGRVSRVAVTGYNGQMIFVDDRYDSKGQLARRSNPYFEGTTLQNSIFGYDNYGRRTYHNIPGGNNTTYAYALVGDKYITTATNAAGQAQKTYMDKSGRIVAAEDNGGMLEYIYHSSGNKKMTTLNGVAVETIEYDDLGRQKKKTDPNYGSFEYAYNVYDEMISQKDPKGVTYTFTYNELGALKDKTGPEGVYTYTYNTAAAGPSCGKMTMLTGPGATHNYNHGLGSKVNFEEQITGSLSFKTQYTYDIYGRLKSTIYPNNATVEYTYNENDGSLAAIGKPGATYGTPMGPLPAYMYSVVNKNAFGQVTTSGYQSQFTSGPLGVIPFSFKSTQSFDTYGYLTGQSTIIQGSNTSPAVTLRNFGYQIQPATGNLSWRKDYKYNLQEDFSYDDLNRLTVAQGQVTGPFPAMMVTQTVDYTPDQNGNIWKKSDAGTFAYDQANRVSEISPYVNIPSVEQNLTYTPFRMVATIAEGNSNAAFAYWADGERSKMDIYQNNVLQKTKYYAQNFEKEIDAITGSVRERTYVYGPEGTLVAILERKDGVDRTYYVSTDHLGSITQIFDESGTIVEEKSFDAWGRARDPQTWAALAVTGPGNGWDRGYTAHEHLPQFGLINMNGRIYDPLLGRMLGPDPFIMGQDNTQGYNRYTYALNNPLRYTDPSGHFVAVVPLLVAVAYGALLGAVSSAAAYSIMAGRSWTWGGFGKAALFGGIAGGLSAGIGSFAAGVSSSAFFQSVGFNILKATTSQMVTKMIMGDKIDLTLAGSVAGGLVAGSMPQFSGVEGGAFANIVGEIAQSGVTGAAAGFVSGGISAASTGRNILEGAFLGMDGGIKGNLAQTGVMISVFGAGIVPDEDVQKGLKKVEELAKAPSPGKFTPLFRRGSIYGIIFGRGVTWGRSLVVPGKDKYTYLHEYGHFMQQLLNGFGNMQLKGIWEQIRYGEDSYGMPGTNEFEADTWYRGAR
ncbi:FG-GAP-like repeat-containing protein [Taibaiella helva]|uniref:FG-GAP-like repeat-containing protein n=1 Tax=Taibaiella helva TaxID=2301235 RepID=UPI0018E59BB8|nr:FG-GAP-like repeat-containing protein [Taibaiella helva]